MFGIFVKHCIGYDGDVSFVDICKSKKQIKKTIQDVVDKYDIEGFTVKNRGKGFVTMEFDEDEVIFIYAVPIGSKVVTFAD